MMLPWELFGQRGVENGKVGARFGRWGNEAQIVIFCLLTVGVFSIKFGLKRVLFQIRDCWRDH